MIAADTQRSELDIDTSRLDCIQANLAAVADRVHEEKTAPWLGATLDFDVREPDDGFTEATDLPTIEPTLTDQLSNAGPLIGLNHESCFRTNSADRVLDAARAGWHLVITDAHELPWVPYYRHNHTGHSVAVRTATEDDTVELVDAYTNDTPWGPARPRAWTIPRGSLTRTLDGLAMTAVPLTPAPIDRPEPRDAAVRTAHALALAGRDGRAAEFLSAYQDFPDQATALRRFTVETWLLARQRQAHAHWLAAVARLPGAGPVTAHADEWSAAAEATYMAMRRAQRGRATPDTVYPRVAELLRHDGRVFGRVAHPEEVRSA